MLSIAPSETLPPSLTLHLHSVTLRVHVWSPYTAATRTKSSSAVSTPDMLTLLKCPLTGLGIFPFLIALHVTWLLKRMSTATVSISEGSSTLQQPGLLTRMLNVFLFSLPQLDREGRPILSISACTVASTVMCAHCLYLQALRDPTWPLSLLYFSPLVLRDNLPVTLPQFQSWSLLSRRRSSRPLTRP